MLFSRDDDVSGDCSPLRLSRTACSSCFSSPSIDILTLTNRIGKVFEILLRWVETRNWEEAFWAVIPKRKFQGVERVRGKDDSSDDEEVNDQDERGDVSNKETRELVERDSKYMSGGGGNGVLNDSGFAEA